MAPVCRPGGRTHLAAQIKQWKQIRRDGERQDADRLVAQVPVAWWRVGFWACIVISVAVVIRRVVALLYPSQSSVPQLAALDEVFASQTTLTLAHILPALAFVLISPFFVLRRSVNSAWPEYFL